MISGIGVDIVALERLDLSHRHFIERVLSPKELEKFDKIQHEKSKREFLGGRFAAKEAFMKANHVGIGSISFQDIEILNDPSGAPYFTNSKAHLSISHEKEIAIAFVVLEKEKI